MQRDAGGRIVNATSTRRIGKVRRMHQPFLATDTSLIHLPTNPALHTPTGARRRERIWSDGVPTELVHRR